MLVFCLAYPENGVELRIAGNEIGKTILVEVGCLEVSYPRLSLDCASDRSENVFYRARRSSNAWRWFRSLAGDEQ